MALECHALLRREPGLEARGEIAPHVRERELAGARQRDQLAEPGVVERRHDPLAQDAMHEAEPRHQVARGGDQRARLRARHLREQGAALVVGHGGLARVLERQIAVVSVARTFSRSAS